MSGFFKSFLKPYYKILVLGSCGVLIGCDQQTTDSSAENALREVRSVLVKAGSGTSIRSFSGTLSASQETSLSFKVSGTIQSIEVDVGDLIKTGDVIATIDPSGYALEVQRSQASLAEAHSQSRNARAAYERTKKLYETGNSSKSDLDSARAFADSAKASVQSAKKALEIAELDLSYTKLEAETDCAIASVDAEEGENISQGTQVLYATCGEGFEVDLNIPESVIARIKKGMKVDVSFPAIRDSIFSGEVYEVGVSSVQGGTTFPVTISVDDQGNDQLKAGLSSEVAFTLVAQQQSSATAIVVPPFSVGEDQKGRFVFVLETAEAGRAVVNRTDVTLGEIQPMGIEIMQGITPGMRVVTAGVSVLRDGMEVKYSDEG